MYKILAAAVPIDDFLLLREISGLTPRPYEVSKGTYITLMTDVPEL